MFAFSDALTLLSYNPPKKKKKLVVLLSTTHDLPDKNNEVKLPEIVEYYNSTKSGVDVFDRMCKNYSTSRKTRRWNLAFFFGLLNIIGVNSFLLWKNNKDEEVVRGSKSKPSTSQESQDPEYYKIRRKRRDFLMTLGEKLIQAHLLERYQKPTLQNEIKTLIAKILGIDASPYTQAKSVSSETGRCIFCQRMKCPDRKSRTRCTQCCKFICSAHQHKKITRPDCYNL